MAKPKPQDDIPEADRAPGSLHPRSSHDLIGHQDAEQKFLRAFNGGRLHHAWMITGAPSIGKATLAYRMIRKIMGGQSLLETSLDIPASDPVSQRIESLGHGDFFLMRRPYDHKTKKLRSEIPVSEARRLREFFNHKPAEGGWRVALIDSMDEMNRNAENAILKTLEEPPDRAIIIMIASQPGGLLPTIHSRCVHLDLRPVADDDMRHWLSERSTQRDEKLLSAAIKLSRGAPGKALILSENADKVLAPLAKFMGSLSKYDSRFDQSLAGLLSARDARHIRRLFWEALQDTVRAQAVYAATGVWSGAFAPAQSDKPAENWSKQWERLGHLMSREAALNMDKKAVMLDALSGLRRA